RARSLLRVIIRPQVSPWSTPQFRIVPCAVDLPSQIPAQRATHDHVGGKMLLARDTGQRHCGGQAVGGDLCQRSWIFMGDHARYRPCNRGVLGGERRASVKKSSIAMVCQRPGALGNGFEKIGRRRAVESRLPGEKPGFTEMVVVGKMSPEVRSAGGADEGVGGVIGDIDASVDLRRATRNLA